MPFLDLQEHLAEAFGSSRYVPEGLSIRKAKERNREAANARNRAYRKRQKEQGLRDSRDRREYFRARRRKKKLAGK